MIDKIEQLLNTLEQEINDGYNTMVGENDESLTYINGAQATLYELQKQVEELKQGLRLGKNFSLLGKGLNNG
tara:strand:+ start:89 stop:304 length:216 start_codon:yes stop_codon:yes gene_type:complete